MSTGYGVFEDSVVVGNYRIVLEKVEEGVVKYKRYCGDDLVVSKTLFKPIRFELIPFYPVFLPERFTNYILVKFDEKVHVPTKGEALIYVEMPIDIAVYVYGPYRKFSIVDVFTTNEVKYALYGVPDRGIVARYVVSHPYTFIPEPELGKATVLINIRNRHDDWIEVGKILLDAQILRLFYVPGTWNAYTQAITMAVNSPVTATIYYGRRIEPKARRIHDPPDLRPPRIMAKTEMLWGIN